MASKKVLTKYREVMRSIEKGEIAPVYCFYGTERWLRQRLVAAVRGKVLSARGSAFNHDRFMATATDPDVVFDAVQTIPMMGGRRLVEVEDLHKWKSDQIKGLERVVDALSEHSCLLLVGDNLDGRLKVFQKIKKKGVLLKLEPPDKRALHGFVESEAKRLKRALAPSASAMLVELVGNDLGALSSSLEKASLYAGEETTLQEEHIRAVVPDLRQVIIFELTDAVGAGRKEVALDALRRLLQEREPPARILVMLGRQVRLLWMALEALRKGTPLSGLGAELKIHPFVAKKLGGQARRCTARGLRRAHQAVRTADMDLKYSKAPPQALLERLILQLTTTMQRP
mgnify:FL=1